MLKKKLKFSEQEIEELVKKSQKGDQDAFSVLYDFFVDRIYKYIYYRVNEEDVEDLVEMVFLKVWENIKQYKFKKKSFSAWIFRIAHNLVVDYYRANKNKETFELSEFLSDENRQHNPIKKTQQILDREVLRVAISKLNKSYQEIITYKFINELSNKEISKILKKTEGSLRILQHRALKALKDELEKMGIKY